MVLKLFLFISVFALQILPQQYPDRNVHKLLISGIEKIINQDYNSARKNFFKLKTKYPELPLGNIYLASVDIIECYDMGIEYNDELIVSRLNEALELSEKLLDTDDKDLWNKYFLGLAEGYYAYYEALNENWLNAFSKGISSINSFRECLNDSTEFTEAYPAIGTFLYWKSRKLESLRWLPFIDDETAEGITYLETASLNSVYNRFLAINSLIWIYIDQKNYLGAVETAEEILGKYPDSRIFKWGYARALEEIDRSKAIKIYNEILTSYKKPSDINEVVIKHKIAQQYAILGNNVMALKLCSEILSKKDISDYAQNILKSRLERVKNLYTELNK